MKSYLDFLRDKNEWCQAKTWRHELGHLEMIQYPQWNFPMLKL